MPCAKKGFAKPSALLEDAGNVCAQEVKPKLPGWPNVEGGRLGGFDIAVVGGDAASIAISLS